MTSVRSRLVPERLSKAVCGSVGVPTEGTVEQATRGIKVYRRAVIGVQRKRRNELKLQLDEKRRIPVDDIAIDDLIHRCRLRTLFGGLG